jgi:glycosyltransferase involved in cell wall biosynthesis
MPLISVIMPVKNGSQFIEAALSSVFKNITFEDEVIVVDDGSDDDTIQKIDALSLHYKRPIQVIKTIDAGPARARNLAIDIAKGELITFLDHDDLWPKDRMKNHLNFFNDDTSIDLVVGKVQAFENAINGRRVNIAKKIHHVHLGATTFKRSVLDAMKGFKPEYLFSEDLDLFTRIRESNFKFYFDNKIALYYRRHESNMTNDSNQKIMQFTLKALLDSVRRRRNLTPLTPFKNQ